MNDPLVRQVVDLFDARLVDLRAQPQNPRSAEAEGEDSPESGDPDGDAEA